MLFQHTHTWITDMSPHTGVPKTQTRRLVKAGEWILEKAYGDVKSVLPAQYSIGDSYDWLCHRPLRLKSLAEAEYVRTVYSVGNTYAVQPGRGKHSVARVRVTGIRREDVRNISAEDARAEGFDNNAEFLRTWCSMHDKAVWFCFDWQMVDWRLRIGRQQCGLVGWSHVVDVLNKRPHEHYQAWVLEFELVTSAVEAGT